MWLFDNFTSSRPFAEFCVVKKTIPEDTDPVIKGASSRTFKLVILEGETFDGEVPKAAEKNAEGLYDLDEVFTILSLFPDSIDTYDCSNKVLTLIRSEDLCLKTGGELVKLA